MKKKYKKSHLPNKPWKVWQACLLIGVFGAFFILSGIFLGKYFDSQNVQPKLEKLPALLTGLGTSLCGGALINFLLDKRLNDPVTLNVLAALKEVSGKIDRVRYDQTVSLTFTIKYEKITDENGDEKKVPAKVFVTTVHKFHYRNTSFLAKKYPLSIFSDFRCEGDGDVNKYDFHFKEIFRSRDSKSDIVDELTRKWVNCTTDAEKKELSDRENNKLIWKDEFKIVPQGERELSFHIHGEYALNDRLIWSFQEVSDVSADVKLTVNIDSATSPKDYRIKFNHPNEVEILGQNPDIDNEGRLQKPSSDVLLSYVILPYQGFELIWGIN
jgi:hypothetical protein